MKAGLTRKEKWFWFWGFRYYINKGTKEIHRLKYKTTSCRLHQIVNGKFVTGRKAYRLIYTKGFNGCRYCFKEQDTGYKIWD